ncbi:hypothetical protein C2G38_2231322 [Gigaspora rosea]|uniref:Uncharacterized protein n=1 Tax=Gigaspora rosea TaxID=44941 RepID=A0A397U2I2_9GLOM|nr:hypothetical protein C2G38_2231322 [Gigaspora rosea]
MKFAKFAITILILLACVATVTQALGVKSGRGYTIEWRYSKKGLNTIIKLKPVSEDTPLKHSALNESNAVRYQLLTWIYYY